MTEDSANRIMESAEKIQNLVAGTDKEAAVNAETTKIFEACNFQDVTGQRMMKISDVLSKMEGIVMRMVMVFGSNVDLADEAGTADDKLMSGPSLKGQGLAQNQVDDILGEGDK